MQPTVLAALSLVGAIFVAACVMPEPSQPKVTTGATDFAELCAPCHGMSATGNGPMPSRPFSDCRTISIPSGM